MAIKNSPWQMHVLLGTAITLIWGSSHGYELWQWPISLAAAVLASFSGAHYFRNRYLTVRGRYHGTTTR